MEKKRIVLDKKLHTALKKISKKKGVQVSVLAENLIYEGLVRMSENGEQIPELKGYTLLKIVTINK